MEAERTGFVLPGRRLRRGIELAREMLSVVTCDYAEGKVPLLMRATKRRRVLVEDEVAMPSLSVPDQLLADAKAASYLCCCTRVELVSAGLATMKIEWARHCTGQLTSMGLDVGFGLESVGAEHRSARTS